MAGFLLGNNSDDTFYTSHLLFAYDTFIFCNVDCDQIMARVVLLCFEAV